MENKFDISAFVDALTEEKETKDLVDRVKERRKELKISQKELSTRTLVSYGSIRRFENSGQISLTSLIRIANALNCLSDFNLLFKTKQITNLKDYKVWLKTF